MARNWAVLAQVLYVLVSTAKAMAQPSKGTQSRNSVVCSDFNNTNAFMQCLSTFVDVTNGHSWCVNASGYAVDLTEQASRGWCTSLVRTGSLPVVPASDLTNDTATNAYMASICRARNAGYLNNITGITGTCDGGSCAIWSTPWPVVTVSCNYGQNGRSLGCAYIRNLQGFTVFHSLVRRFNPNFWQPTVNCALEMYRYYTYTMDNQVGRAEGFNCISGSYVGLPVAFQAIPSQGPGYINFQYAQGGRLSAQFAAADVSASSGCYCTNWPGVFTFSNVENRQPSNPGGVYNSTGSFALCAATGNIGSLALKLVTQVY